MLQSAQSVGEFAVIRLLGKGGMGEVYEAQQLNPPRRVALKVLAPWLASHEDALRRFEREARVAAQLDHPNIVRIYLTGRTDDGLAYYAMQLVRGMALARLLRISAHSLPSTAGLPGTPHEACRDTPGINPTPGPADCTAPGEPPVAVLEEYRRDPFRFTARVGLHAARALAHAHRRGYLHRDIKPANLMMDGEGHIYLVDFGLTRALEPEADGSHLGTVRGTPWYMSPEQAHGEPVDHRADLYALGVTLFELASRGVGPFNASRDDAATVLAQVKAGVHRRLRTVAPEIPRGLERVIRRCMERRPAQRYQSAADLAADLERLLGPADVLVPVVPKRGTLTRRIIWGLTAAAAGVLIATVTAAGLRDARPGDRTEAAGPAERPAVSSAIPEPPKLDVAYPLLKGDNEPIWIERTFGRGKYAPEDYALSVMSFGTGWPTLLALHKASGSDYEFATELRWEGDQFIPMGAWPQQVGIYFGRHEGPGRPHFFAVTISKEEPNKPVPPALRIWTAYQRAHKGAEAGADSQGSFGSMVPRLLDAPNAGSDWHHVRVVVRGEKVRVFFDRERAPLYEFDMADLRRDFFRDPRLPRMVPHGELGIWVRSCKGAFRNMTLTFRRADVK
jgi:serine/threonine protein kinase